MLFRADRLGVFEMNPKELFAVFGIGCKNCEHKDDCPNAFTEVSHHCGAYPGNQEGE